MSDSVRSFYDDLAQNYHLLFQDWDRSIEWQASVLGALIEAESREGGLRILDAACGIGTQSLGLAGRGHAVTGVDLSDAAIARAEREARARELAVEFQVADMRDLSTLPADAFDVVLAVDNALPHLLNDADLERALGQMASRLRPGGLLLATIRDYDQIVAQRPAVPPPGFFQDGPYRRIYHQVWDWSSGREYTVHLYLTRETADGWSCNHYVSTYRALLREELTALLLRSGFADVRWLMPVECGFYQPLVLAYRRG